MAYVYGHFRNDTGELFYIGKGTGNRAWNNRTRNSYWKHIVDKCGYTVEILYDNLTEEDAFIKERFLISSVGRRNLTNLTDGGDGFTSNDAKLLMERLRNDESYKKKISDAVKNRWKDETYRQRITESSKEKWNDLTYRQRITEKAILNSKNPEYIKKISDGVKAAIETKKDVWSECKQGSKNGRWLGEIEMYDDEGNLYKTYESAVECKKETGMVAHYIRNKARTGQAVQRGQYTGYTFRFKRQYEKSN
jgi:hypothetical protein